MRRSVFTAITFAVLALAALGTAAWAAKQDRPATDAAAIPQAPAPSPDLMPLGQSGNWKMIFRETFSGNTLDTSKWSTCYPWSNPRTGCTNNGNNELQWYLPDGVSVSNDTLKLTAQQRPAMSIGNRQYSYTSGMVSTGPNRWSASAFAFQYGYVEARIKLPAGKGYHAAFWMLPTDRSWPPELDVLENWGDPRTISMNVHWKDHGKQNQDMSYFSGPDLSADFHIYGLSWSPNSIVWYVDGVPVKTVTDISQIPSKPMYLVLNLAINGNDPPDVTTPFPGTMEVAYVRVWQQGS